MQNNLMYKDILILIFGNAKNSEYFKKYYGETQDYQNLLRDYQKHSLQNKNIQS